MNDKQNIPWRASGILMPLSSIPSPYGIGAMGAAARKWVDFLKRAGQSYWQVLPLGPTSYGDSPYQSFSAFAGNPYFIDLDTLCNEGLLKKEDYCDILWNHTLNEVDYALLYENREKVLRKAYARFKDTDKLMKFKEENELWIDNYALYMAIKATQGNRSWIEWEPALSERDLEVIEKIEKKLEEDINFYIFIQYQFFKQWKELKKYANENSVEIIGDIPIYVALDSADVWADKTLFQLDEKGLPIEVAGCPPDGFSADGQLWGNPLYDWESMAENDFAWWITRLKASFELYDVLRIDHFRGLERYYAIPYGDKTARNGRWRRGPGMRFVNSIKANVPEARIIAEDLGFLTDEVRKLLADSGYPGMKVLQFAFESREPSDYSPYNHGLNNVVYTGTHDNDTLIGWIKTASDGDISNAMEYTGVRRRDNLAHALIRLAMQSHAILSIIPIQDWLEMGSKARINTPSTIGGNWIWRSYGVHFSDKLADSIYAMTELYGRLTVRDSGEIQESDNEEVEICKISKVI